MPVIPTNDWLLESYQAPIRLCGKMKPFFNHTTASDIYDYFCRHGMYHSPKTSSPELVQTMENHQIWQTADQELQALQAEWQGPDIPVFLFPANTASPKLLRETNGKSGLAFADKLILFVPETIAAIELKALFIHEYNHVCRMHRTGKAEESFTLLDSIILEGLAEHAVRERLGKAHTAPWTALYPHETLETMWQDLIHPNRMLRRTNPLHDMYLYGSDEIPEKAGYCVGDYLVAKHLADHNLSVGNLLAIESEIIAGIA